MDVGSVKARIYGNSWLLMLRMAQQSDDQVLLGKQLRRAIYALG
jgi:hypothetical protein